MLINRYGADVDCRTKRNYTPLHRCAFYNHPRLAGLLVMAGADQTIRDENNETPYEVSVTQQNTKVSKLLKPLFDNHGNNIAGIMYATNNPKHPNFPQEARDALFRLFDINSSMANEGDGDEDEAQDEDSDQTEEENEEVEEGEDSGEEDGDVNA